MGQSLGQLQQWQKEQEAKGAVKQMQKDKEDDRKAKERVREQIKRDRYQQYGKTFTM